MRSFSLQQWHKIKILAVIWLFAGTIGIGLRLYPLLTFISPDASEKATMLVITMLQNAAKVSVDKSFPNASDLERRKITKTEFDAMVRSQQKKIRQTIYQTGRRIDQENPYGQRYPYLLASDSYYYYGLTETILKTGQLSPQIKGSKFFHPLMQAPLGFWEPLNLHPYVGLAVHRFMTLFDPQVPLMFSVSLTALPLTWLALIPFLVVCSFFRCSSWGTFVGSVYFLLAPIFLKRSCFGWYDDDPYNILFPLLILSILFYGFRKAATTRHYLILAAGTVMAIVAYAFFWHGWVFFESVILISGVLILIYNHWISPEKPSTRNLLLLTVSLLGGVLAGISLVFGPSEFFVLFQEGWTALNNFLKPQLALWPDLYISVGELRKTPWPEFMDLIGGTFFFLVAVTGFMVRGILALRRKDRPEVFSLIILTVFFSCIMFLALEAQRFVLMSMIPLAIFFTLGIDLIFSLLRKLFDLKFRKDRYRPLKYATTFLVIAVLLILLPWRNAQSKFPGLLNQIYNATWDRALTQIKLKTPPESVINTWWPPGHFIKAIAQRRVTFDGATINKPQAYWIANIFLSADERLAAGLLRMLNNSANQAPEYLQKLKWELSDAVTMLKTIAPLNRIQARQNLANTELTPEQIEHLLLLTHKATPPTYLLIYNELLEKNLQLTFVGLWNFKKAQDINRDPKTRQAVAKLSDSNRVKFLWDMAGGGPPRASDPLILLGKNNQGRIFQEGVMISNGYDCQIRSEKFGNGVPLSVIYLDGDNVNEKRLENANLSYSVLLPQNSPTETCILMERDLARSLIMQLFYFNGKGLRYFEPLIHESDLTRRTEIKVFRVNWERFLADQDPLPSPIQTHP